MAVRARRADKQGCARAVSCMMSTKVTAIPRHRDSISCLVAPRARDLTGGLVRGPVQLLARPAAVLYALARTASDAAAVGAARARAAAALASPGRACARTRGSGARRGAARRRAARRRAARRRAALNRAGRKRDGLRRDRHGRDVGEELVHGAFELVALDLVALGALGDQRRDGGGERSSRAL
jgi:hypothetical protein